MSNLSFNSKFLSFRLFRYELNQHKKMQHGVNNNNNNNFNTPRVQLSCSLCTYKTFSQDILDDHMDSQHRGLGYGELK